jgi:hypothetical protein
MSVRSMGTGTKEPTRHKWDNAHCLKIIESVYPKSYLTASSVNFIDDPACEPIRFGQVRLWI